MFDVSGAVPSTHNQLEQIHADAVARTQRIHALKNAEYSRRQATEGPGCATDMLDDEDGWSPMCMQPTVKFSHVIKINPAIAAALKNDEGRKSDVDLAHLDECATNPPFSELELVISHDEREPDLEFGAEQVEGTGKGKDDSPVVTVRDILARLKSIQYDVVVDYNKFDPEDSNTVDWHDTSKSEEERDAISKRLWDQEWRFQFCEVSIDEDNDFGVKFDAVYYSNFWLNGQGLE